MIVMYKLRIYKTYGIKDHEEIFDTKEEMDKRYNELFCEKMYASNPTAWEFVIDRWRRLEWY
jgi:hypothetical protein